MINNFLHVAYQLFALVVLLGFASILSFIALMRMTEKMKLWKSKAYQQDGWRKDALRDCIEVEDQLQEELLAHMWAQGRAGFWEVKMRKKMSLEEWETIQLELADHLGNCREAFLKNARKRNAEGKYADHLLADLEKRFPND